MKNIYCTLFNQGYLDKGLVLVDSLRKKTDNFRLYIFAMDQKTYDVLVDINDANVVPINVQSLEDTTMKKLKNNRSFAEYCWTWTPLSIRYVLEYYKESICTYIDADMYFYEDPLCLINEMESKKCNVQIVRHNFPPKNIDLVKVVGEFCVEFNTFTDDEESLKILDKWCSDCLKECSYNKKEGSHGDQMYLSTWPSMYSNVNITTNIGAGVAPWNTERYKFNKENDAYILVDKYTNTRNKMVFYHFQNLRYISKRLANINLNEHNVFVRNQIYLPYLLEIDLKREFLSNKYGIHFSIKKSSYKNPILKFIQNYIMPFKFRKMSNIVKIGRK